MRMSTLKKLCSVCAATLLTAGLAGAAEPSLKIENRTITRDGKPFFPLGLVFGITGEELEQAKAVGMNSVHMEYSMLDLFPNGPELSQEGVERIRRYHANAREHDMVLFPLLTGHYIPGWLGAKAGPAPTTVSGERVGLWFPHSMYNPEYRKALENFWKSAMEAVGDDDRIGAFVLWNEPGYGLDATEYAVAAFRQAMRGKYGDIAAFNAACRTDFADFDAIVPPRNQEENRNFFYEWFTYNQQAQADFFQREADFIKSVAPNVRVTNKHPIQSLSGDTHYCNDIVLQSAYQDLFGCDFYGGSIPYFRNVMELARSLNRQGPVISYETHAQKSMPQLVPGMAVLELFAQVIGGCRGMFLFCAGDENEVFGLFNRKATPEPVFQEMVRFFKLVNGNQAVFAAPRRPAKIAVLLANPSVVHYGGASDPTSRDDYAKRVNQVYDLIRNQHFAVDFISDRQFAEKLGQYELLVIPSRSILSNDNLARLGEFHRNGGKILAFGGSLARNEAFEEIAPPAFLGISERKPSPWNRGAMRLTEVSRELVPFFRTELIVQNPEIVNPVPLETLIPGYTAKTDTGAVKWLAANQDAYASIVQSSDGRVVYCAFDSLYSEGLSALIGGIVAQTLGMEQEISAVRVGERAEALEILSAVSDTPELEVLMLANAGPQAGRYRIRTGSGAGVWQDLASGAEYSADSDGAFEMEFPAYGYAVLTRQK